MQMKETEITFGVGYKINKGDYQQQSPLFSQKVIISGDITPEEKSKIKSDMQAEVNGDLDAYLAIHRNTLDESKVIMHGDKRYVRITAVIYQDGIPVDKAVLEKASNRGIEAEKRIKSALLKGKFDARDEMEGLKLGETFGIIFDAFKWNKGDFNKRFFHDKWLATAELDWLGEDEKGKKVIIDFKTGSYKYEQLWAQRIVSQYDAERLIFVDLKNAKLMEKKPNDLVKYGHNWLYDRGRFRGKYGA